ncbi:epoxyqueuosine reductase [candidate division KSB1 bacterium]|nr:epoxyqueuosine reductase [candidate division KSB1 bacterium]
MVDSTSIKSLAQQCGADLCGIASNHRFDHAPAGFHPTDIFPECQSIIVLAKGAIASTLQAASIVPYSHFNDVITQMHDELLYRFSLELETLGIRVMPVPVDDPYLFWDAEKREGRGILSLRHAGMLAGLGTLGRNTLLKNKDWGNMIRLRAVLVNILIQQDPITTEPACPSDCTLCLEACPSGALDGKTANQKKCRNHSQTTTARGFHIIQCNTCRKVCPQHLGDKRILRLHNN